MAVYVSPDTPENAETICRILRSENKDGITNYVIELRVSLFKWQVKRRYRQFVELNEKLARNFSINRNLLPPKKIIGNRSESFITERQKKLEEWLRKVLLSFNLLPEAVAIFLDFQKYEIRTMTSVLSEMLLYEGEDIIAKGKPYEFSPLQLHAITERLKLEDPPYYTYFNPKQDISHLVEFVTNLKHLKINGSSKFFESSNIVPNCLFFDLSMFKNLLTLEISNCVLESFLTSVNALRAKLNHIRIYQSVRSMATFLQCEFRHWSPADPMHKWPLWQAVTYANFSYNSLKRIDPSIKLLNSVQKLDLSHNEIVVIENLDTLSKLSVLILSHNKIEDLDHLHTRLGNIQSLNLGSNRIECLHGLAKLCSVSELYLEHNSISSMAEISNISKLPCLGILNLQNNPVSFTVDYRSQLLLNLESLAPEITIDGVKATEKEMDTVSILQALNDARPECCGNLAQNGILKNTNSKSPVTVNTIQLPSGNLERNSTDCAVNKASSNLEDVYKFRQRIETLRRTGGTDWLRYLNEIAKKAVAAKSSDNNSASNVHDMQLNSLHILNNNSKPFTLDLVIKFSVSFEMAFPDCVLLWDSSREDFKQQLFANTLGIKREISSDTIGELKFFWFIVLYNNDSSLCEAPMCVLLLQTEIVFLRLHKLVYEMMVDCDGLNKAIPELVFEKSFKRDDILSLSIGPNEAYTELKIKYNGRSDNLVLLTMSQDDTTTFVKEFHRLYDIKATSKLNPFANDVLDIEKLDSSLSISKISVHKKILFGHRVRVSKVFHKSQRGILHHVFVTESHVLLVEERLHFPQIIELDLTIKPQFQVCAIVSVHTNIKQIHLKDIDYPSHCVPDNIEQSDQETEIINWSQENEELGIFYKCSCWLILEFESQVMLYLNFFSLEKRNKFLDQFYSARQKR